MSKSIIRIAFSLLLFTTLFACKKRGAEEDKMMASEGYEKIEISLRNTVEQIVGETMSMAIFMEILLDNEKLEIHGEEPTIVQKHILNRETSIHQSYIFFVSSNEFENMLYPMKKEKHMGSLLSEKELFTNDHVRYVMSERKEHIYRKTGKADENQIVCIIPFFTNNHSFSGFVKNIATLP